jgi:hypothetical protein
VRPLVLIPLSMAFLAVGACSVSAASAGLPADVTAAQITWHLPTSGASVPPSTLNEAEARSLVHAINAAPAWPDGVYNCPEDDGSSAKITFLRSGHPVATVTARLTGCARIAQRKMPAAAANILINSGPPGTRVFSNA